jgi:hypothetical protein
MPATSRLRHVAQWQNCPANLPTLLQRESPYGTSLHSLHRSAKVRTNDGVGLD